MFNQAWIRSFGLCAFVAWSTTSVHSVAKELSGAIRIDGSSTVYPISSAVGEEFQRENRKVRLTVSASGTGGGFKKFCLGETDINDASREIKDKEKKCLSKKNINYVELPVAYDGLSVVVSKKNTWLKDITMAELKALWNSASTAKTWNQIRSSWPNKPIKLFGPGTDSGTFDFFTKKVNGKSGNCRSDFTASEDDNVLVKGVAGSPDALAYFGYAYYAENKSKLRAVKVLGKKQKTAIAPTETTIKSMEYTLSRPIYIYVSNQGAKKTQVREFIKYYMKNAKSIVKQVGYVPLETAEYDAAIAKFNSFVSSNKLAKLGK